MGKSMGIGRDWISNGRSFIGTGFVIIPSNNGGEDRDKFVKNCLTNQRVSIVINEGGVKHNCFVLDHVISGLKFPDITISEQVTDTKKNSKLGSQIAFFNEPYLDQTIIIGIIAKGDETNLFSEEEYRIIKSKDGNYAILSLDGKSGDISIINYGDGGSGNLNINIKNKTNSSIVSLGVGGNININVTGDVNLNTKGNINLTPAVLNVGDVSKVEAILKGDSTVTELEKCKARIDGIIDAIKNGTPTGGADGGAALQASIVAALALIIDIEDYSKIKSEKTFSE